MIKTRNPKIRTRMRKFTLIRHTPDTFRTLYINDNKNVKCPLLKSPNMVERWGRDGLLIFLHFIAEFFVFFLVTWKLLDGSPNSFGTLCTQTIYATIQNFILRTKWTSQNFYTRSSWQNNGLRKKPQKGSEISLNPHDREERSIKKNSFWS